MITCSLDLYKAQRITNTMSVRQWQTDSKQEPGMAKLFYCAFVNLEKFLTVMQRECKLSELYGRQVQTNG